tara:strand:+ start:130 stop:408 length:279 start_codon:yes stop_codon:yes gene_type:complete
MKFKLLFAFAGILALIAVSCVGDERTQTELKVQEPIEVPALIESEDGQSSCRSCVRGVVRRVVESPVVSRVVGGRRIQRKPVRTLLRRLLRR